MAQENSINETINQLMRAEISSKKLNMLLMYEHKEIFETKLKEGYTEFCSGAGQDWIGDRLIIRLYAFYHPSGRISTYEFPKINGNIPESKPIEYEYNTRKTKLGKLLGIKSFENSFEDHVKEFKIALDERKNLAELVKILDNQRNGQNGS